MNARNDLVLIDNAIKADQATRPVPLPDDVAFELFSAEQVLRTYELDTEEIEDGRVGGGMDGAIDCIYTFLGEDLLSEDSDILTDDFQSSTVARGTELTLWAIQAKQTEAFGENALELLSASLSRLLDLSTEEATLLRHYSERVVSQMRVFTTAWQKLATRRPRIRVRVAYATRGDTIYINDRVLAKSSDLETKLANLVPGADCKVLFIGAKELWELRNQSIDYTLELPFEENATKGTSHVALVQIADYFKFITSETGDLQRHIFDWNVRDFQGDVLVNREIRASLEADEAPDFWWLNNGITIICSEAKIIGKTYVLHDVRIVNGLQTSHTIYETMSPAGALEQPSASRSLLVRILVTDDEAARDKVIRATNRQTNVPEASLRATDDIQRKIEAFFLDKDWYYDRRKNFYKNSGRSSARIVSIPFLAQAVMAMGLSQPDYSRARPSSLLKKDDDYRRVFSNDIPLATYLWLAKTQRLIDSHLGSSAVGATVAERTNFRFHVAMLFVVRSQGGAIYSPKQLRQLAENNSEPGAEEIKEIFTTIAERASTFNSDWAQDRTAKNKEFVTFLLDLEDSGAN